MLAEPDEDHQVQLNTFGGYCVNWKMRVNANKTNVMVFWFGRLRQNFKLTNENVDIELNNQFNYIGVTFTKFLKWEDYIDYLLKFS